MDEYKNIQNKKFFTKNFIIGSVLIVSSLFIGLKYYYNKKNEYVGTIISRPLVHYSTNVRNQNISQGYEYPVNVKLKDGKIKTFANRSSWYKEKTSNDVKNLEESLRPGNRIKFSTYGIPLLDLSENITKAEVIGHDTFVNKNKLENELFEDLIGIDLNNIEHDTTIYHSTVHSSTVKIYTKTIRK